MTSCRDAVPDMIADANRPMTPQERLTILEEMRRSHSDGYAFGYAAGVAAGREQAAKVADAKAAEMRIAALRFGKLGHERIARGCDTREAAAAEIAAAIRAEGG